MMHRSTDVQACIERHFSIESLNVVVFVFRKFFFIKIEGLRIESALRYFGMSIKRCQHVHLLSVQIDLRFEVSE